MRRVKVSERGGPEWSPEEVGTHVAVVQGVGVGGFPCREKRDLSFP